MRFFLKAIPKVTFTVLTLVFVLSQVNITFAETITKDEEKNKSSDQMMNNTRTDATEKNNKKSGDLPDKKEDLTSSSPVIYYGESIYPLSLLAKDTTLHFIEMYGKDSLLKIVNNRIIKAVRYLNFESKLISDEFQLAQLILYSKEFKLGFDTLKYSNLQLKVSLVKLYGRTIGKASGFFDTLEFRKKTEQEISALFLEQQNNRVARVSMGTLSNYFNLPQKSIDTLNALSKRLPLAEQIETYYVYTEFLNNNPSKAYMAEKYKPALLQKLYVTNNLNDLAVNYLKNNNDTILYYPYSLLAYGLYGKDLSLKNNHLELMYLISLQNSDGGWRNQFSIISNESDRNTSIYALWALCEFRDQLIKYKVKPE